MFKLALIQMTVEGGRRGANLHRAAQRIADAAQRGADLLLLPEAMDLGWTHPSALELAEEIPTGATCSFLRDEARVHGVFVCSGLIERAGNAVFNSAVLINPAGDVLLIHRKLNELVIGQSYYGQGDRLGVVHTQLGTLGVMICADAFARGEVVTRSLGYMGAQVILSPSAWAVPADHDNERDPYGKLWRDCYGPVARDFRLWIAGASCVGKLNAGPWQGRHCIGCSLVIRPNGTVAAQGPYGTDAETTIYVDVEPMPRPARGDGWESLWSDAKS